MRAFGKVRKGLGLDVETAAARLLISVDHLRKLESGRAPLTEQLAARMAAAYDVRVSVLTCPWLAEDARRG